VNAVRAVHLASGSFSFSSPAKFTEPVDMSTSDAKQLPLQVYAQPNRPLPGAPAMQVTCRTATPLATNVRFTRRATISVVRPRGTRDSGGVAAGPDPAVFAAADVLAVDLVVLAAALAVPVVPTGCERVWSDRPPA
jgi:hypothetical protein